MVSEHFGRSVVARLKQLYHEEGMSGVINGIHRFYIYNIKEYFTNIIRKAKVLTIKMKSGRYKKIELKGYIMELDLEDEGISQDLALDGIREPISYHSYRRELSKFDSEEKYTIVEIGANIGYYALAAASDLKDCSIYCAELSNSNVEMLRRNVGLNGFEDIFTIDNVVISDSNTIKNVRLSDKSNHHSLRKDGGSEEMEPMETKRGSDWLHEMGVEESNVDVLRMDIEGAEAEALKGMENIRPKLAHIELHPTLLDQGEFDYLIDRFKSWNMKIKTAADDIKEFDFESLNDIPTDLDVGIELVLVNR